MKQDYEKALYARINYRDGHTETVHLETSLRGNDLLTAMPELSDWPLVEAVDYAPEMGTAKAGEEGYYVIPHGQSTVSGDSYLCRFRERADDEMINRGFAMTMWGFVSPAMSFMATVPSMTYEYELVTCVEGSRYQTWPRFVLHGEAPYEPIRVLYRFLPAEEANYNGIALAYRRYREERGEITPYVQKAAARPAAAYTANSVYIRIRQGWKPCPPLIREQTPENEPPMRVASTFNDVSALLDELAAKGVDQAEICLVGWNIRGHDGRWPQIFPVEEALGGEEQLKTLTAKAKAMGYAMVCHTNSSDAYSIANSWSDTQIIADRDGKRVKNDTPWSGGDMYQVCPVCGLRQARELLPKVREMGFSGTHYIDVLTTVQPRTCHDPAHPATKADCVRLWNQIARLSRSLFGGFSSEGAFDFAAPELDYGLYVSFGARPCNFADEYIPLWQLVYHGYIISNPFTTTVNPVEEDLLKVAEYGGRPSFYYDSKFVTPKEDENVNWMGENDYHCHTDEDRKTSAVWIAKVYNWYRGLRYLQMIPMLRHETLADGSKQVTYENGDVIRVNYQARTAFLNDRQILPLH